MAAAPPQPGDDDRPGVPQQPGGDDRPGVPEPTVPTVPAIPRDAEDPAPDPQVPEETGPVVPDVDENPNASGVLTRFVDKLGNEVTDLRPMGNNRDIVNFLEWPHAKDPQVTGIRVWMSEPVEALQRDATVNVDGLQYRCIDYIPRQYTESHTGQAASTTWADRPLLRFDNDVMPDTARITLYNDRIFAPTDDGLRYSDVDGTILRLWAFPEVNAVRRAGIKDAVAHRGVLLFGGPADFHSLTGTSGFDFVVNRLGTLGPVSPHAMQVLRDSVAFAGASGFYVTDGVQVFRCRRCPMRWIPNSRIMKPCRGIAISCLTNRLCSLCSRRTMRTVRVA